MKKEIRYGYHFLTDERRTGSGDLGVVKVGKLYKVAPPITVCRNGLHGSTDPLISLRHAPGAVVTWCEFRGPFSDDTDGKFAAAERKVLAISDVTKELHEFAMWAALRALLRERNAGREPDERSWNALRVKTRWLKGTATDAELGAAWEAALGAALGAAREAALGEALGAALGAAREAALGEALGEEEAVQRKRLIATLNRALGIEVQS